MLAYLEIWGDLIPLCQEVDRVTLWDAAQVTIVFCKSGNWYAISKLHRTNNEIQYTALKQMIKQKY